MDRSPEQRSHPRVETELPVFFEPLPMSRSARSDLRGIVTSTALRGMFIATPAPLPRGEILSLRFYLGEDSTAPPVRARAIVRWRRRLQAPAGMGIEFIDFEPLGEGLLEAWIERAETSSLPAFGPVPSGVETALHPA